MWASGAQTAGSYEAKHDTYSKMMQNVLDILYIMQLAIALIGVFELLGASKSLRYAADRDAALPRVTARAERAQGAREGGAQAAPGAAPEGEQGEGAGDCSPGLSE